MLRYFSNSGNPKKHIFVITDNPFQLKAVYEIDDCMNKN